MSQAVPSEARPLVTLVLRCWRAGQRDVRYQATHVQTGEIAYFGTVEALIGHLRRLEFSLLMKGTEHDVLG